MSIKTLILIELRHLVRVISELTKEVSTLCDAVGNKKNEN